MGMHKGLPCKAGTLSCLRLLFLVLYAYADLPLLERAALLSRYADLHALADCCRTHTAAPCIVY
jgi:hypothetical protein